MTQAEKRARQLQEMGIEEADLNEVSNDVLSNKKDNHRNSDSKPSYNRQITDKSGVTTGSSSSDKEKGEYIIMTQIMNLVIATNGSNVSG